jgi:3-dehydroquinate dehydratase II
VADEPVKAIWLLHGVNLDMLGARDPRHYGRITLAELEDQVVRDGAARGFEVRCYQTNHEGDFVEKVHEIAREGAAAVIVNPGAWTHYSYAIRDALELVEAPLAEVHLSAVDQREEWRSVSVIADLVTVRVSGKGAAGYTEALAALAAAIESEEHGE